jgi:CHAT domain-containing protein
VCRLLAERPGIEYVDFELEIGPEEAGAYPVSVLRSPAGEPRGWLRLPFDGLELENKLQALKLALLSSSASVRRMPSPEDTAVEQLGGALFDSLFTGEVRSCFDVSRHDAAAAGKGLRIKLRIQGPEVAALPWEFLYDVRTGEYLSLSKYSPIVRYLELATPVLPLKVDPPLRMLAMVASPEDLPALNVERERLRVETALAQLTGADLIEVAWILDGSWRTLQRQLDEGPWHLFHFSGHGRFDAARDEGTVTLVDEHGGSAPFRATQLARMLADHPTLRLVVLNACEGARGGSRDIFSGTASILVRRGIPAVLAMQYEIGDAAAVEFARTFYESVARGMPIDAAVAEARKAISFARGDSLEWGTPVLYTRAPDGVLFRLDPARLAEAPHAAPEPPPEPLPVLSPREEGAATSVGPERGSDGHRDAELGRPGEPEEPAKPAPPGDRRRARWIVAAVLALPLLGLGIWAALQALGGDEGVAPQGGLGLENAAVHGSYAMTMKLVTYRNGPQLLDLWGADADQRQLGRIWPQENWLFSSLCYPTACDTEVTVEGRGLKTWRLTKDGREYSGVDEGAGCKGATVTRAVHFTVSSADTVGEVYTATSVEGRLSIDVTCTAFNFTTPEHAEFSLSGTLNPA